MSRSRLPRLFDTILLLVVFLAFVPMGGKTETVTETITVTETATVTDTITESAMTTTESSITTTTVSTTTTTTLSSEVTSAQIYSIKPVYLLGDVIIIVVNTPTGISDARLWIDGAPYQNNLYIGSIAAGTSQYPIGPATRPGPQMVVLTSGGTQIATAGFIVDAPPLEPPQTTETETTVQYKTATVTSYQPPQLITIEKTEYSTETLLAPSPPNTAPFVMMLIIVAALIILSAILAQQYFAMQKRWRASTGQP